MAQYFLISQGGKQSAYLMGRYLEEGTTEYEIWNFLHRQLALGSLPEERPCQSIVLWYSDSQKVMVFSFFYHPRTQHNPFSREFSYTLA